MSKKSRTKSFSRGIFHEAVISTQEIAGGYCPGLKALGANSSKIQPANPRLLGGSVDIDSCILELYPEEPRWDYALDYNEKTYFVEVHPASTNEVGTVIKKLVWLRDWLKNKAPDLEKLKAQHISPFVWIPSGKGAILPNSPQARRLSQCNIRLVSILKL